MRFVPTGCVRPGMRLGKSIYKSTGELLLAKGVEFVENYIERLQSFGINGVYIDDALSKDIEIENVISDELRLQAVQGIRKQFIAADNKTPAMQRAQAMASARRLVEDIVEEILENKNMMINMVDLKVFDEYTYYHSVNVAVMSVVIGVAIRLQKEELMNLGFSALLHDIGKVFVDKNILNKPGRLTAEEFEEIKKHSAEGHRHLSRMFSNIPVKVSLGVLQHHERFDGSGYPRQLRADQISLYGRIIAIADVYDALVSDRPYRKALLPAEAVEHILGNGGSMFDPNLVKVFSMKVAPYPLGTCVKLSNGWEGIVVENYEGMGMRPDIRVFKENGKLVEPFTVSLLTDYNLLNVTIVGVGEAELQENVEDFAICNAFAVAG